MLPDTGMDRYWADIYPQPVPFYLEALEYIRTRHALPEGDVSRFPLGRNVVFAWDKEIVVKLIPPFWQPDVVREETALRLVGGKLSVATPEPLASGHIDDWGYLVMSYIPGEGLGWDLSDLGVEGRIQLARQQGTLLRLLRGVAVPPVMRDALAFDWPLEVTTQQRAMKSLLRTAGVADHLVESAETYVAAAGDLTPGPLGFLHGDLSGINLTVKREAGRLEVLGLLDFSDAALGPAEHEYISPVMHQFRGEPEVLNAFWTGAGIASGNEALQHRIMARSLLKYPDLMGRYLERLPGAPAASWQEAASRFFGLA